MKDRNIKDFYKSDYEEIYGQGVVGWMSKQLHKSIENSYAKDDFFEVVCEVGAGHGEHLNFVKHNYAKYLETDLDTKLLPMRDKSRFPHVEAKSVDAVTMDYIDTNSIDRLIATCVLPHLSDPEVALQNWKRVVKPGGCLSIYIPCEPGILLRLAQNLTSKRKIEKLGLDYRLSHYREHSRHFPYLRELVDHSFKPDSVKWSSYPIPFLSWNASLWYVVTIQLESTEQGC